MAPSSSMRRSSAAQTPSSASVSESGISGEGGDKVSLSVGNAVRLFPLLHSRGKACAVRCVPYLYLDRD
ncbi:hypothetical protein KIPB_014191, partial [Kipferlia bialata]|eukprot:g14191.t1